MTISRNTRMTIMTGMSVFFLAFVLAALSWLSTTRADEPSVVIYQNGKEYATVPLSDDVITVRGSDGRENVLRITEEGVWMESSTCPNQDCVGQGMLRHGEQDGVDGWIICLPNGVSVEISD